MGGDKAVEVEAPAVTTPVEEEPIQQFETQEFVSTAIVLRERVALQKIESNEQYSSVCQAGLDAAANIAALTAYIGPFKDRKYRAWKRICDVFNDNIAPFEEVKKKASVLAAVYQSEMAAKKEREDAAERERLQKEAEERKAKQAEQLANEGRIAEGVALLEEETVVIEPVVSRTEAPKVRGVTAPSSRFYAYVESNEDLMKLVKAVAAGEVPLLALRPTCKSWEGDDTFLDKQANSFKKLLAYPGVTAKNDPKVSFRGR